MIPEHRLAVLLDQVKQNQISRCTYHNTLASPSLYSDHMCDRNQFPLRNVLELGNHSDEVWALEFSHDGTRLASAGQDRKVIVYDVPSFGIIQTLQDHGEGVVFIAWSPDDSKLISCSRDRVARVWDTEVGRHKSGESNEMLMRCQTGSCLLEIDQHTEPVTTASWAPDGKTFVTGSLDRQTQLCVWDLGGNRVFAWSGGYRVQDCSITPDGKRLVVISVEKRVYVYNFRTREEEYSIPMKRDLNCIKVSRDSKHVLVSTSDNEIQMLDIATGKTLQKFLGRTQNQFVIRNCFGGAGENFVVSGSEGGALSLFLSLNLKSHADGSQMPESTSGAETKAAWWKPWMGIRRAPSMLSRGIQDCRACLHQQATTIKLECECQPFSRHWRSLISG